MTGPVSGLSRLDKLVKMWLRSVTWGVRAHSWGPSKRLLMQLSGGCGVGSGFGGNNRSRLVFIFKRASRAWIPTTSARGSDMLLSARSGRRIARTIEQCWGTFVGLSRNE
jgi:hypothetical protein